MEYPHVIDDGRNFQGFVYRADALTLMAELARTGTVVDAVITDLPYGTTACAWDNVIPFAPMWDAVKRILKPRGVFVTIASQPFTSALVMSNPKWFRYAWVWDRSIVSGFLDANRKPLKCHEDICVFCEQRAPYYPQMSSGEAYTSTRERVPASVYGAHTKPQTVNDGWRFPTSILDFPMTQEREHPTQKPTALYEYLIRTYTQPGELVLDFCVGSGTTALAARNTGRRFIVGDSSAEYVNVTLDRLRKPFEPRAVVSANNVDDLPLFRAPAA